MKLFVKTLVFAFLCVPIGSITVPLMGSDLALVAIADDGPAGAGDGDVVATASVPNDLVGKIDFFCDVLSRFLFPGSGPQATLGDVETALLKDSTTSRSPLLESADGMIVRKELLPLVCGRTINNILDRLISDDTNTIQKIYFRLSLIVHPDKAGSSLGDLAGRLFQFVGQLKADKWDGLGVDARTAQDNAWLKAKLKCDTSKYESALKKLEAEERELAAQRQRAANSLLQDQLMRLVNFDESKWREFLGKHRENHLLSENLLLFFLREDVYLSSSYSPVVKLMRRMISNDEWAYEHAERMLFSAVELSNGVFASPVAKSAGYVCEMVDFYHSIKQQPSDDIIRKLGALNKSLVSYSLVMHPRLKELLGDSFSAEGYIDYFLTDAHAPIMHDLFFNKSLWELDAPVLVSLKNLECLARDKRHYDQLKNEFTQLIGRRLLDRFGSPEPEYIDAFINKFFSDGVLDWLKFNKADKYYSLSTSIIVLMNNTGHSIASGADIHALTTRLVDILLGCSPPTEPFLYDQSLCNHVASYFNIDQLDAVNSRRGLLVSLFDVSECWQAALDVFNDARRKTPEYKWFLTKIAEHAPSVLIKPDVLNGIGTSRLFSDDELNRLLDNIKQRVSPAEWAIVTSTPALARLFSSELATPEWMYAEGRTTLYAINAHYTNCIKALSDKPDSWLKDHYRVAADAVNFAYTTQAWEKVFDPFENKPNIEKFAAWLQLVCLPEVTPDKTSGLHWALYKSQEWVIPKLSSRRGLMYIKDAWEFLPERVRTEEVKDYIADILREANPAPKLLATIDFPRELLPQDMLLRLPPVVGPVPDPVVPPVHQAPLDEDRVGPPVLEDSLEQPVPPVVVPAGVAGIGKAAPLGGLIGFGASVVIAILFHKREINKLQRRRFDLVSLGHSPVILDLKIAQYKSRLIKYLAMAGLFGGAVGATVGYIVSKK